MSGRGVDVEVSKQFDIDDDFILMFKCLGKVHFYPLRIYHNKVVEEFLQLHCVDAQFVL